MILKLLERASKRGRGQQPILIGGIYKGLEQHVSFKAGHNDEDCRSNRGGHDG